MPNDFDTFGAFSIPSSGELPIPFDSRWMLPAEDQISRKIAEDQFQPLTQRQFENRWYPAIPELPTNYRPPERYNYGEPVRLASAGVAPPVMAYAEEPIFGDTKPPTEQGGGSGTVTVKPYHPDISITERGEVGAAGPANQANISLDTGGSRSYLRLVRMQSGAAVVPAFCT